MKRGRYRRIAACFLGLCLGSAAGQTSPPAALDTSLLAAGEADYRLGGGDLLEISTYGIKSFQHTVRVSASGVVRLPLLGEVAVEGRTAAQLEAHLEDRLRNGFIQEPTVSVFVREYKSRTVFVLGSVRLPGQYQVVKQLRVIDVITMAGGLGPEAGDELLIQRQAPTNGSTHHGAAGSVIQVNLAGLLTGADPDQNVALEDGDVITVAQRIVDYYYVVGEVNGSGSFALPKEGGLLASQALARAGGAMKTAKIKKGLLVRYDEDQQRHQSPLNFAAIFQGTQDDVTLQANDIIFVPGSGIKSFGYAMLQVVPGTAQRAVVFR